MAAEDRTVYSWQERENSYSVMSNIIDMLDISAINELMEGTGNDIQNLFDIILEETDKIINLRSKDINSSELNYLPSVKKGYEHYLRCTNLNYFTASCLPEFDIQWFHIEWMNMIQLYKYLCIIASRDHSKSFTFSFANILWGLYRYEKPTQFYIPPLDVQLCKETMLITNEFSLAKRLLKKVKAEIESNPIFQERLFPDSRSAGWGETALTCKTGAELTLSSFHSSNRGPHPGRIIVDDFLDKSALYSKTQREKFHEVFTAEVMNMILPQGQVCVVGCVEKSSLILTKDGFIRIGDLNPTNNFKEKSIQDLEIEVLGKEGWNKTSKFFVNGKVVTNKITTKGGFELECSEIHPLWRMGVNGIPGWCKSNDLEVGDWIEIKGANEEFGKEISLKEFLNEQRDYRQGLLTLPEYLDKDLAYLMGLFIAEGNYHYDERKRLDGLQISSGDQQIEDFLFSLNKYGISFKCYEKYTYTIYSKNLARLFLYLGFNLEKAQNKIIPNKLLSCRKEILREIIKGMFDGDGTCSLQKEDNYLSIQYYSSSEKLIKTLQTLLLMGWDVFSYVSKNKKIRGNFSEWVLTLQKKDTKKFLEEIGFRLERKSLKDYKVSKKLDFVPSQNILLEVINIKFKESEIKGIKPYVTSTIEQKFSKYVCKKKLVEVLERSEKTGFWCKELDIVKRLSKEKSYWVQIKEIQKGEAETVDFVIPEAHNFITNCISSHNTPFHEKDLYSDLKEDPNWKVFEYPAIFPDGRILYDGRYNYEALCSKRKSLGSLIFSREILVKPISDNVSIFPYAILEIAFINMQSLCLVNNRQSYPIKFKKISVGCDFALSSTVGADYTVYTVVGLDSLDQIHLVHSCILHGAGYNQQIIDLQRICNDFQPETVVMEVNGFQKVMAQNAKDRGIQNIIEFSTNGFNKKDLYEGLPSLAVMFETGVMKLPRGDEKSKQITDSYCSELNSMAFDDDKGKLESVSEHDDKAMSLFFAIKGLKTINSEFRVSMLDN